MGFTAENTLTALLRECQFDETVTFGRSTGSISDVENRANTIEREREREKKIDPAFTSDHLSDKSKFQCGRKIVRRAKGYFSPQRFISEGLQTLLICFKKEFYISFHLTTNTT